MEYGDMTVQDEAVVLPLRKIITTSRNMADATSSVGITGIGFRPSYISLYYAQENTSVWGYGFSDGTTGRSINSRHQLSADTVTAVGSIIMEAHQGSPNTVQAEIVSLDIDGFTINYTKINSPTGVLQMYFTAFK